MRARVGVDTLLAAERVAGEAVRAVLAVAAETPTVYALTCGLESDRAFPAAHAEPTLPCVVQNFGVEHLCGAARRRASVGSFSTGFECTLRVKKPCAARALAHQVI